MNVVSSAVTEVMTDQSSTEPYYLLLIKLYHNQNKSNLFKFNFVIETQKYKAILFLITAK